MKKALMPASDPIRDNRKPGRLKIKEFWLIVRADDGYDYLTPLRKLPFFIIKGKKT